MCLSETTSSLKWPLSVINLHILIKTDSCVDRYNRIPKDLELDKLDESFRGQVMKPC